MINKFGITALFAVFAAMLSACGFQPLYGDLGKGQNLNAEMEQVAIYTGDTRVDARLHNELADLINPNGPPSDPKYRLNIDLKVSQSGTAYQIDASVSREEITIAANYDLIDIATNETLLSRRRTARASQDVQENQFANLVTEENAELRASKIISEFIQLDLALYFDSPPEQKIDQTLEPLHEDIDF